MIGVGRRSLSVLLKRVTEPCTYAALGRMARIHKHPWRALWREVFSRSGYPTTLEIQTPVGLRSVRLFNAEDLSTFDSVFCRLDYGDPHPLCFVVDFGSNIGITGLYWLTRNPESRVYLYEPVPQLLERLRLNLTGLEDRYTAEQVAVSNSRGPVEFGVEPTGRLGGIGTEWSEKIEVRRDHVMNVLGPVLDRHGTIDCLKVDIEGHEDAVFRAIDAGCWKRIRYVAVEDYLGKTREYVPDYFTSTRQLSVLRFTNTLLR